ncbi:Disease resistance protein RGA2 [Rhynchospora pubera]|uniref:Disease resistance protein RGA2 n=1 Tax=Rhynchospora pubera TaxID=906938 RepID=A0AAV8HL32_9POAL|nr:Disease resistance protein RGA2 [Rhynchospora pubera]
MDWAQSEVLSRVSSRVTDAWGGIGDDVDKLRVSLLTSNILADEAERWRFVDHNLSRLLLHLKDAIYDAEDVIDDFDYQELKMSVEGSSQASRILNKASSLVGEFISGKSNTVKDVQQRLDLVQVNLKQAMKLLASKRPETVEQMHAKRKTGSVVIEPEIIGRDSDKETIIKILLQLEDTVVEGTSGDVNDVTLVRNKRRKTRNVSVLPIVGMGGLGKTTLARMVYNDARVKEHFQLKIWICVSDQFDVNYLTKEIVKCATGMQENSFPNLDSVYNALKEEVLSMKFLLVLDDVWNEAPLEWDKFYLPMCHGVEGSMILLTTRSTEVAKISGTLDPVFIEGLPEEPYRNLFNKCAFGLEDPKDYPELGAIAEKIRSKLKGSPLAAKTLGGLLRTNLDVQHWRNIMTSELWQMKQREGEILPALQLSYWYLPSEIKRCFSFCCMFPKGFWFRKEHLVSMWVAHGFVMSQGDELLEQRGALYFEDLLSRSLFHLQGPGIETYLIHDLMHDLAQLTSKDECFYIQTSGREQGAPKSVRHLSVAKDLVELIRPSKYNKLRSLSSLRAYQPFHGLNSSCHFLFSEFPYLRIFDMNNCGIKELPESIGNLKHLRYLNLSDNKIEELPESIGQLYNLQVFDLFANPLKKFPKGFTKLIGLRKLRINPRAIPMISGIGKLISLQDLSEYQVQRQHGHRIGELKDMTQLLRKLYLSGLENIDEKEEAAQAMLSNKRYLDILILGWADNRNINQVLDEEVLQALQPHPNLMVFHIYYYGGLQLPSWLQEEFLPLLNHLSIAGSANLNVVGNLPSSLCVLEIERCHSLISIEECLLPEKLPVIKKIILEDCKELKSVPVEKFSGFVFLQELKVSYCPKITCSRELLLPTSIKKLVMQSCGNLDISLPNCLKHLTNLSTLRLEKCLNITSLTDDALNHLIKLQELSIRDCEKLSILGRLPNPLFLKELSIIRCQNLAQVDLLMENSAQGGSSRPLLHSMAISDTSLLKYPSFKNALPFLQTLEIEGSKEMSIFNEEYQEILQNLNLLKKLSFSDCANLQQLPPWLHSFTSLNYLKVVNCPQIKSLPENGLPISLTEYRCARCNPVFIEQFKTHMAACHQVRRSL